MMIIRSQVKFMKLKILLILGILSLVLLVGCSEKYVGETVKEVSQVVEEKVEQIEEEIADVLKEPLVEEPKEGVKEFSISAKNWEFSEKEIRVSKGDLVKLTLSSEDVLHGFSISEFGIKETLKQGETSTVEFEADKKGTFIYYCSIPCGSGHRQMKGKLIIE
jgi:cytochrome c oxidase subunit II